MKITITKKYLTFPLNTQTALKRVCFKNGSGELVYDLECKLDAISPNFTAYVDVSRFMGQTLDIDTTPYMEYVVGETDEYVSDEVYKEELRPKIHFTVKNGWNNDPNGLIKMDGVYHMFFQYNPCSAEWGNMHWGHAVSTDLIHWEEKDYALYPDEFGTMYSGSAIEDKNGIAPVGTAGKPKMLLYYTAAANNLMSKGKKHTQRLAYSEDGGKTFVKYNGAPMVDFIEGGNRDPKVIWVDELNAYALILYLDGNRFAIFKSTDLVNWERFQDITLPSDRECPDLFPLTTSEGEKLWVIIAASDFYIVGKFVCGKFVEINKEKRLNHNRVNYAAQTYSGIDDGRVIRTYWQRAAAPSPTVTQQMSIPTEMTITRETSGYYLHALPVKELETLRKDTVTKQDFTLTEPMKLDMECAPLDITLETEYNANEVITLNLFGASVRLDMKNNVAVMLKDKMPLSLKKNSVKLRVIVDRCTVEVFADDGKYLLITQQLWDRNLPFITLSSTAPVAVKEFTVHTLKSIH